MGTARINNTFSDDIMTAKGTYAMAGSLVVGLMLWIGVLALIV